MKPFAFLTLVFCLFSFNSFGQPSAKTHPYASLAPMPEPTLFAAGVVSTAEDDLNAAFSPDGNTVYFTRNFPRNRLGVILFSNYKGKKWLEPQIASFSGTATDYDPFFAPDGSKIFFCTNRGIDGKPKSDFDIWYVERTGTSWSEPRTLGSPVNSPSDEYYPSVASDGTIYFSSNRAGGKGSYDIYRSRWINGTYAEPENLGDAINLPTVEIDNYISPDQKFLVFAANGRKDDLGGGSRDLYINYNNNGTWTKARNLGAPINSPQREYCPIGSPDGKYFFFSSFRGITDKPVDAPVRTYAQLNAMLADPMNGRGNVFQIDIAALGSE